MARSTRSLWLVDAYNVLRVNHAAVLPTDRGVAPDTQHASSPSPRSAAEPAEPEQPAVGSSGTPGADAKAAGWWSAARRDLLVALATRLPEPGAEVCLVFDARHLEEAQESAQPGEPGARGDGAHPGPHVRCIFTPSADDWIVQALRERSEALPGIRVVTADRPLANRARRFGAEIVATDRFLALCRAGCDSATESPEPPAEGREGRDGGD